MEGSEPRYLEPTNRQVESRPEPIDAAWFEALRAAKGFDLLEGLENDADKLAEQRSLFEQGAIRNPELSYPKANIENLRHNEADLLSLKEAIKQNEEDIDVRNVYVWKINEAIAMSRMLQASAEYSGLENSTEYSEEDKARHKDKLMRRFTRYSKFVFGKPSAETLAYANQKYIDLVQPYIENPDEEISSAAQRTAARLSRLGGGDSTINPLEPEVFNTLRENTLETQGSLIDFEGYTGRKGIGVFTPIFESALEQLGATEEGWKVINDDPDKTVVTVKAGRQSVYLPSKFFLSAERVKELIIHEIGTHVERARNGYKSELRVLSIGLDRYEAGEEGLAMAREQTVHEYQEDETDYLGMDRNIAVALALGMDGQPHDFRSVYEAMFDIHLLSELSKGKSKEKAFAQAQKNAWIRALRTYRGTDGKTAGACFTKDIAYAEGSVSTWFALSQTPELMQIMLAGKYDISNPRHVAIVMRFGGFSDTELEELEAALAHSEQLGAQ